MGKIDLHMHTTHSDGSNTPEELIDLCLKSGFSHISITDHDTMSAYEIAVQYSRKINGPEIIPGVEFTCNHRGNDIHILAYYIPFYHPDVQNLFKKQRMYNEIWLEKTLLKLADHGYPVNKDDVYRNSPSDVCKCPHILAALNKKGYVSDNNHAIDVFLSLLDFEKPAYVHHDNNPHEILEICTAAGAVTSIAHPHRIKDFSHVRDIIKMGVHGIEYYSPGLSDEMKQEILELAREFDLILTGGSDFHGVYSLSEIGDIDLPGDVLSNIRNKHESLR